MMRCPKCDRQFGEDEAEAAEGKCPFCEAELAGEGDIELEGIFDGLEETDLLVVEGETEDGGEELALKEQVGADELALAEGAEELVLGGEEGPAQLFLEGEESAQGEAPGPEEAAEELELEAAPPHEEEPAEDAALPEEETVDVMPGLDEATDVLVLSSEEATEDVPLGHEQEEDTKELRPRGPEDTDLLVAGDEEVTGALVEPHEGGPEVRPPRVKAAKPAMVPARSEFAPVPELASHSGRALAFWLAFAGCGAAAASAGAAALSVWDGGWLTGLEPSLLTFASSVVLLMLGILHAQKRPPAAVCRRAIEVVCLVGCGAMLLRTAVHMGLELSIGTGPGPRLETLVACGVASAIGCALVALSWQGVGWARRCLAASVLAVIVFVALMAGRLALEWSGLVESVWHLSRRQRVPMAAVVLCSAGLAGTLTIAQWRAARRCLSVPVSVGWLLLLLGALGWTLAATSAQPAPLQVGPLLGLSALAIAAGLLPAAAFGVVAAWRSRGSFRSDMAGAAHAGWWFVLLGGPVLVALWLARGRGGSVVGATIILAGGASMIVAAWLGLRERAWSAPGQPATGGWMGRWGGILAGAAAVALAGGGAALRELFVQSGIGQPSAQFGVFLVFLWALITLWLIHVAIGMAIVWRHGRARDDLAVRRADSGMIYTAGWVLSGLVLWLYTVAATAGSVPRTRLLALAIDLWRLVQDGLRALAGPWAADAAQSMPQWLVAVTGFPWSAALVFAVLCALAMHLLAAKGVSWARWVVVALWVPAVVAGAALLLVFASQLFLVSLGGAYATQLGRVLAASLTCRLAVFTIVLVLLVRLSDGLRAVAAPVSADGEPLSATFGSLMSFGAMVCAAAAGLCVLLALGVRGEEVLFQLYRLAAVGVRRLPGVFGGAGGLSLYWTGYVVALALTLFVLLLVHEEARRGKVQAWPLMAAIWFALLAQVGAVLWTIVGWLRWPIEPGVPSVAMLGGALWIVLVVAVMGVLVQWWRRRRTYVRPDSGPAPRRTWPAVHGTFGRLGLLVFTCLLSLAAYGVARRLLLTGVWYSTFYQAMQTASWSAGEGVHSLRAHVDPSGWTGRLVWVLAGLSGALLVAHYAAQYGLRPLRFVLVTFWSVVLLSCASLAGYLLAFGRPGQWSAGRALGMAALVVLILSLLNAVSTSWVWLIRQPAETEGE